MTSDRNHLQSPQFSEQKPGSNPVLSIAQSFITEVRRYLIVVTPLLRSVYSPVLSRAKENLLASLNLLEQELTLADLKSGCEPSQQNEGSPPAHYQLSKGASEDLSKLTAQTESDSYDSSGRETLLQLENETHRQQISALQRDLKRLSIDSVNQEVTALVESAESQIDERFQEMEKLMLEKQKRSEAVLEHIQRKLRPFIRQLRKEKDLLERQVQGQMQTHHADIDVFKQEIAHFTAENRHLETENESFASELTNLRREIGELKQTLSQAPVSAADSFSKIQTEVLSLRSILEQGLANKMKENELLHQQEVIQLNLDLEALKLDNSSKQALLLTADSQIQSLTSEVSQLTLSLTNLRADYLTLQALERQYEDKCVELQLETVRLSSGNDMLAIEHLWETEKLNKEIAGLEEKCLRWDDLIAMCWEDAQCWASREVNKCQAEIQELKDKNWELEEEVSVLGNDNSFLHHEFEELEETSKDKLLNFSIPDEQLEELKFVVEELKSNWAVAITREKEATGKVTQLVEENNQLRNWTGMLQEDIFRPEEKWEATMTLQVIAQEQAKKDKEIQRLKSNILKLTETNMDLQRGLKFKDKEIAKCEEHVYLTSKQMDFMRMNLSRVQGISNKETEIEQKASDQAEYTLLLSKYEKVKLKFKKMKNELAESMSKQEQIQSSCQRAKQLQETLSKRLKSALLYEDRLKALQEEMKQLRSLLMKRTEDSDPTAVETLPELRNVTSRDLPPTEDMELLTDEMENLDRKLEDLELLNRPEDHASAWVSGSDTESDPTEKQDQNSIFDLEIEIQRLQTQIKEQAQRLETLSRIEKIVFQRFPDSLNLVKIVEEAMSTINNKSGSQVHRRERTLASIMGLKRGSVVVLRPDDISSRQDDISTSSNLHLKPSLTMNLVPPSQDEGEGWTSGHEETRPRADSNHTPREETRLETDPGSLDIDEFCEPSS